MASGASSHSWDAPSASEAYIVKGKVPPGKGKHTYQMPTYGAFSGKGSYKGTPVRKMFGFEKQVARAQKFAPTDGDKRTFVWNETDERRVGANGRAMNSSAAARLRRTQKRQAERNNANAVDAQHYEDEQDGQPVSFAIPDDGAPSPGLVRSDIHGDPISFSVSPGVIDPLVNAADAFLPTAGEGSTLTTEDGLTSLPRSLINEDDDFVGPAHLEPDADMKGPHYVGLNQFWVFDDKESRRWWKYDGDLEQPWFEDVCGDRYVNELAAILGKVPDAMQYCLNRDAPATPPHCPLIRGPDLVADMAALTMEEDTTNRKPSKDIMGVPMHDSWEPDIGAQQPPSQPAPSQPEPEQAPSQPAPDWGQSDWWKSDSWSESGEGYTQADWDEWKAKKREEAVSWQSASSGSNQETIPAADNRRRSANAMWEADSNGQWSAESWEAWKADAAERKAEWAANNYWSVKKCRR